MSDAITNPLNKTVDVIAAGGIVGTLFGYLPAIASVLSIIWFGIQIYESRTFTHWKNNWIMKHKAKKIARLKAKEKVLAAQILAIETVRAAKVEASLQETEAKTEATLDVVHDVTEDA